MGPEDDAAPLGLRSSGIARIWRASLAVTLAFLLVASAAGATGIGFPAGTATADSDARVDVVFVVDRSESMSDDWDDLAHQMGGIDDHLEDQGVDARYTVISYEKSPEVEQPWTRDFSKVENSMDFSQEGHVENSSVAIQEAISVNFDPDAERVVVLVTDEDDDGTAAEREEARSALSSVNFVTIAPSDASKSDCSNVESEPCDNDDSNELRQLAQDVGGNWIDVDSSANTVVDETGAAIETAATGSTSLGAASSSSGSSSLRMMDLSVNRTTAEVGEPVEISATIVNSGGSAGTYDALFADENGIIEKRSVEVQPESVRTVRFIHTYNETDNYELFVTHQFAGRLEVVPRPDTSVETRVDADGSALVANVSDPRANTSVSVPLEELDVPADDDVTFGNLTVTPASDEDFQVEVLARSERPNGTAPLPTGVRTVTYLTANTTTELADGPNATTAFEYTTADDALLYRYEPNGSAWTVLDARTTTETGEWSRLVATSPGLSHFAVGFEEPAFEVTQFDVEATAVESGDPIEASVTVANEGVANGTYVATLVADGEVVDRTEVFVPVGESRTVDLGFVRHAVGDVHLSVAEESETTVSVEEGSDAGEDVRASTTQEPTTTESDGQPGFGAVVLVAALLISTLVAIRRR